MWIIDDNDLQVMLSKIMMIIQGHNDNDNDNDADNDDANTQTMTMLLRRHNLRILQHLRLCIACALALE